MFCESRSPRRAVAVLFAVPIVFGAACASKSDADLFDSTPKPFAGRPSVGGAGSSGASGGPAGSSATGGAPASGGSAAAPVPAKGGSAGADPGDAAAGEPSGMGGASDATGGMASTGGKPAMTTGGKAATGSAGGGNGGQSSGGQSGGNGGQSNGGQSGGGSSGGSASGGSATGGQPACVPEAEMCDGVDNDCDGESDEGACSNRCHGFTLEAGRYMVCSGDRSESQAHESCRDEGMRLAWLETAEENAALAEQVAALLAVDPGEDAGEDQVQVRIGGSDAEDEGVWRWEAPGKSVVFWEHEHGEEQPFIGAALDGLFANWAERRPNGSGRANEDCLVMNVQAGSDGDAGQWNDIFCDDDYPFVCER